MSITTDAQPSPGRFARSQHVDARDRADMEKLQAGHDAALERFDGTSRHAGLSFSLPHSPATRTMRMISRKKPSSVFSNRATALPHGTEILPLVCITIAANLTRNHFRWRARHPNLSLDAENPETEQIALAARYPANKPRRTVISARHGGERSRAPRCREAAGGFAQAIVLCEWEKAQHRRSCDNPGGNAKDRGIPALSRTREFYASD